MDLKIQNPQIVSGRAMTTWKKPMANKLNFDNFVSILGCWIIFSFEKTDAKKTNNLLSLSDHFSISKITLIVFTN